MNGHSSIPMVKEKQLNLKKTTVAIFKLNNIKLCCGQSTGFIGWTHMACPTKTSLCLFTRESGSTPKRADSV